MNHLNAHSIQEFECFNEPTQRIQQGINALFKCRDNV